MAASSEEIASYQGNVVDEIVIEGLNRIEKDAVIAKLITQKGQPLQTDAVRKERQRTITIFLNMIIFKIFVVQHLLLHMFFILILNFLLNQ